MKTRKLLSRLANADFADSVGFCIHADGISAAHIKKRFQSARAVSLASRPLDGSSEVRRNTIAEFVREFTARRGMENARVSVAIERSATFVGQLDLPATAAEDVERVVSYELDRIIPVPADSVCSDCYSRELGSGGERVAVTVLAANREVVEGIHGLFADVGLSLSTVSTHAVALNDYYCFCRGKDAGVAGLFHNENGRTYMTLSCNGLMVGNVRADTTVETHTGVLQREIERVLPDLSDVPSSVVVDLGPTLALLAPEGFLPEGAEPAWAECAAIGVALGQVGESYRRVNLLPTELIQGEEGIGVAEVGLAAVVVVLAAVLAGSVVAKNVAAGSALTSELERLSPLVTEVTRIEEGNRRTMARLRVVEGQREKKTLTYLKSMTALVPKTAYLTTFRYKGDRLEVDGIADNASGLISILERSPHFKNVQFTAPTTKYLQSQERFSLRMELE